MPARLYTLKDLLVLIFVRGWINPSTTVQLEGLGKMKFNDLIRTQPCDFVACSIEPHEDQDGGG
jgi:hypothetical protein